MSNLSLMDMVIDLENHGQNLTDDNIEFIENMSKRIGNDQPISKAQREYLEQLHEEKVDGC